MKTLSLALIAVIAACASPQAPAQYERGTLRPAPAAPARPGVGAPTYDPAHSPLGPQPGPKHGRVLPQTPESRREPGIWASQEPEPAPGTLFGYYLPRPEVDDHESEKEELPRRCAALMQRAHDALVAKRGAPFTNDRRLKRCIAADLYLWCVELIPHRDHRLYDATRAKADKWVDQVCVGLEGNPARDTVVRRITDEASAISSKGGQ